MNKGRTNGCVFSLLKANWEIFKNNSEILVFISELISEAFFVDGSTKPKIPCNISKYQYEDTINRIFFSLKRTHVRMRCDEKTE